MSEDLYSDYIVYTDESGDHGLQTVDPQYPVFVLAFLVFRKDEYRLQVSSSLQNLKFRHFGHDMVILHERDIRKASGPFRFLVDPLRREAFLRDLNDVVEAAPFTLVASVIHKSRLLDRYTYLSNPYHMALAFGMERVHSFLRSRGQHHKITHFVFESRGKKEDGELAAEFQRVCRGANYKRLQLPFESTMADKKTNCCGLQLADLVARPIGRRILEPEKPNRAYEILSKKLFRAGERVAGLGLKVFP